MTLRFLSIFAAVLPCVFNLTVGAKAHDVLSYEELKAAFGADFSTTDVTIEELRPGLYALLAAPGSNMVVSIGEDGILLVDSHLPEMTQKIKQAIKNLDDRSVDYLINTHWHFDHVDGNGSFVDDGALVIGHQRTRTMLLEKHLIGLGPLLFEQNPSPKKALPVITLDTKMQLHFNNQLIDFLHVGSAHTVGDVVVFFRGQNVVHMGDLFDENYPIIDFTNGGSIDGMIAFNQAVLKQIDDDTIVVPGHGKVSDKADLQSFTDMLIAVRDRVQAQIDQGKSLDDVQKAKITADFDPRYGDPTMLLHAAYMSLIEG